MSTSRTGRVVVGALCGLAWASGLRGFMAQVAVRDGSSISWMGTFGYVLAPGVAAGALLGLASFYATVGGPARARWLVLAPFTFLALLVPPIVTLDFDGFLAGGIGGGTIGVPATGILGAYALAGRRTWLRVLGAAYVLVGVPAIWASTSVNIGGPELGVTHPRGLWVGLYFWSFMLVLAVACAIPLRIRTTARA